MYYIYSLIFSIVLFFILQIINYNTDDKKNKQKDFKENLLIFFIMYVISTIIFYFFDMMIKNDNILDDKNNILNFDSKPIKSTVDINLLKKIPEEVNTGFSMSDSE